MPYPADAMLTPKHLGYLHEHLKIPVSDIVAAYPKRLTRSLVYLGFHHYLENQKAYDAELRRDIELTRGDVLTNYSMSPVGTGSSSLAEAENVFKTACENHRAGK